MSLSNYIQDRIDQGILEIDCSRIATVPDRDSFISSFVETLDRAIETGLSAPFEVYPGSIRKESITFLELDPHRYREAGACVLTRIICRLYFMYPQYLGEIWSGLITRGGERDRNARSDMWVGWKAKEKEFLNENDLPLLIEQIHSIVKSSYPPFYAPGFIFDEKIVVLEVNRLAHAAGWELRIRHEAEVEFWPSNPHTHVICIEAEVSSDLKNHSTTRVGQTGDELG